MDTTIYVFSGTGTSLAVAAGIYSAIENAEILPIPYVLANTEKDEIEIQSTKVGIIFPCYFGSVPDLVIEFIRKANFKNAKYIFAIVTCGGGNAGISIKSLAEEINHKGKSLDYGKSISLSSNYMIAWYYRIVCKQGDKLGNALHLFKEKVIRIADDITCEKVDIEKSSYFQYKLSRFLSHKELAEDTRLWDSDFNANEKCNGCGICSKVCQVQNIKMMNQKPSFQHNCQRCMACIQYCPKNAIRYKNKTLNKPHYFHPDFPANKIIGFNNHH